LSEATLVWRCIREACGRDYWKRIENRLEAGFPDSVFCFPDGRTGFVEFKYKEDWPIRASTTTDLGLSKEQIVELKKIWKRGGRSYLLARINNDFLLVRGEDVGKHTRQHWEHIAVYRGRFDYQLLRRLL
jgi:hypothetical protein